MKDDIFSRPLVILGQNCVELMSVNLPSPLPWLNCPVINISLCLLSEWEGQRKRNIQFGIHVKYLEAIGKIFGYISVCKITWRFLENMLSFQKMFGKHLRKILTWIFRIILYNTFSIEVIWTLLLICTCIHLDSEFSLLFGSYLQRRHYIKNPSLVFSCDGKKFVPLHLHIYTQIIE